MLDSSMASSRMDISVIGGDPMVCKKFPLLQRLFQNATSLFFLCKREQKGTIISDHMLHIVLQVLQACLYNVDVGCPGHICWKRSFIVLQTRPTFLTFW